MTVKTGDGDRRDEILRRMLKTPPKPHATKPKPDKPKIDSEAGGAKRQSQAK